MSDRHLKQAVLDGLRELSAADDLLNAAAAEYLCLHRTDLRCLDYLARNGPVPAGQLGNAVGLTSGALTIAVDRLERTGFVQRQSDAIDRRRVLVALAPAAQQATALFSELRAPLKRRISMYSETQLELLNAFLEDMSRVRLRLAESILERSRQRSRHGARQRQPA